MKSSIFDLFNDHQILLFKSNEIAGVYERSEFLLSVLIDNKSVSFLIKCPTPVIELWRHRRQREKWKKSLPLKSEHKTKEQTHNVGNIFDISFHEVSQKYAFCLSTSIPSHSLIPYVFASPKKETILQVNWLSCQRINDSWNETTNVLSFYQAHRKAKHKTFQKVLIYLKMKKNVLFSCKCIIKCKQMISNANRKSLNVWKIV